MFLSSAIVFPLVGRLSDQWEEYIYFTLTLFASYILAEQITIALLMMLKDNIKAAICSLYITSVSVVLGSGILRSFKGLQEWLFYFTYALQIRYASLYLSKFVLLGTMSETVLFDNKVNCTNVNVQPLPLECLNKQNYVYLSERYSRENNAPIFAGVFDEDVNLYMSLALSFGIVFLNFVLHMLPLPTFANSKFR